jgi:hypothetical protein
MEEDEDQRVGMKLRRALMSVESNVMINILRGLRFLLNKIM